MAGIFSEEGLLKKNPLRGSSLATKFASLAGQAGVADVYTQPVGLKEAASTVSSYTDKLGQELPKLSEQLKEADQKYTEQQSNLQTAQTRLENVNKALQRATTTQNQLAAGMGFGHGKWNPNIGIDKEVWKHYFRGLPQHLKQAKPVEQYKAIQEQVQADVEKKKAKLAEYEANLNQLQAKVSEKRTKQERFAAFRNFSSRYAAAVAGGMGRDQFLASVHGQMGPPPEVISEVQALRDSYAEAQTRLNEAKVKADQHRQSARFYWDKVKEPSFASTATQMFSNLSQALSAGRQAVKARKGEAKQKGRQAAMRQRAQALEHKTTMATAGLQYLI